MPLKKFLVAIPQEWGELLNQFIEEKGFSVLKAYSYSAALEIIQSEDLYAVVMISDWAVTQDNGSPGLIKYLKGKVPTYSLITETTYRNHWGTWIDELYERPCHEYQHMPAVIDAVTEFLLRCGSI